MLQKIKRLRDAFIEDCAQWWKLWSSWLAIIWAIIVTAVWNAPETLSQLVETLPPETRALLSPLVLGLVGALPIIVRLIKQQKLIDAAAAKKEKE